MHSITTNVVTTRDLKINSEQDFYLLTGY